MLKKNLKKYKKHMQYYQMKIKENNMISLVMPLSKVEQLGEIHYKGTFNSYANGYGQGGDMVEPPENCCRRLMQGNILPTDRLQGVYTLEWEEWESPLLGLQLRYLSGEYNTSA